MDSLTSTQPWCVQFPKISTSLRHMDATGAARGIVGVRRPSTDDQRVSHFVALPRTRFEYLNSPSQYVYDPVLLGSTEEEGYYSVSSSLLQGLGLISSSNAVRSMAKKPALNLGDSLPHPLTWLVIVTPH